MIHYKSDLIDFMVKQGISKTHNSADAYLSRLTRKGQLTPSRLPNGHRWAFTDEQFQSLVKELFTPGGSGQWHGGKNEGNQDKKL